MENNQQELIFKLSMFEQQIQQLQQQLQAVDQSIMDMSSLNLSLDELKGAKGKEIFSPIGRGIFARTKFLSEELTVDVGARNFVKKTIPETKEIINEQIEKLKDVKDNLNENIEKISGELQKTLIVAQEQKDKK